MWENFNRLPSKRSMESDKG
jgi:hypothetical protein